MIRAFVAVCLPRGLREELTGYVGTLKKRADAALLRWARAEGFHVTLKFLGNVPEEGIPQISDGLKRATAGAGTFSLRVGPLQLLGSAAHPRVLACALEGEAECAIRLAQAVEREVSPLGYPTERRAFRPHLTLARVCRGGPRKSEEALARLAGSAPAPPAETFGVREVALMKSELNPAGSVYIALEVFPLG